ncbi:MAG: DNA damage-inducible protein D [Chloroflexi bacterium]|nr:DNA damage-inducible protein D [Chloroflexota bacterium]
MTRDDNNENNSTTAVADNSGSAPPPHTPDFDSIRQLSPYGAEYWSARDLAPLLGYDKWQNFEVAINRAKTSCEQVGQIVGDHFTGASKMVTLGSGAKRTVKDFILSRLACYLAAQNGDPRKPEIAAAQNYFALATRKTELAELKEAQDERLYLREQIGESNKSLNEAARSAGVLPQSFGTFHDAGYRGLYGGLGIDEVKDRKGIPAKEDLLDRMGQAELAANFFRITQTNEKLRKEEIIGQANAIKAHRQVGQKVRKAIEDIGGDMPETLPAEPSIKPLLDEKKKKRKKAIPPPGQVAFPMEDTTAPIIGTGSEPNGGEE